MTKSVFSMGCYNKHVDKQTYDVNLAQKVTIEDVLPPGHGKIPNANIRAAQTSSD